MRRLVPCFALCSLVILGCGSKAQFGGISKSSYPERIISLSPSASEIIGSTVTLGPLKGRTEACNYPGTVTRIPVVASVKPDYEKIAKIEPDLIIYDADLYNESDVKKLEELGATLLAIRGNSLNEYYDSLFELSKYLNTETEVSAKVDQIEGVKRASLADPAEPTPKVAVMMPGLGGEHWIAGTKSLQADVVRAASGEAVGPDSPRFVKLNAEALVRMNPDIIVASGNDAKDAKPILDDPRLATVTAVKKGRIVLVNPDILLRRGWRVDQLIEGLHNKFLEFAGK